MQWTQILKLCKETIFFLFWKQVLWNNDFPTSFSRINFPLSSRLSNISAQRQRATNNGRQLRQKMNMQKEFEGIEFWAYKNKRNSLWTYLTCVKNKSWIVSVIRSLFLILFFYTFHSKCVLWFPVIPRSSITHMQTVLSWSNVSLNDFFWPPRKTS